MVPDFIAALPKVELHLHLEGAIPLPTLLSLVEEAGGDPTIRGLADLEARFAYRDFPHFIDTWVWKNRFLTEYAHFTLVAEGVARRLAEEGVVYAELFYSPPDFPGLELGRLTEAVTAGLAREPRLEARLICDVVRDHGPARALRTVEELGELAPLGVIGIGLGGSEQAFPPEPFAPAFARARALGLRTVAHAGEAAGPASIRGALDALGVERLGHGVRAVEDPALLARLVRDRVPLEVCPRSNVLTGVAADLGAHPIWALLEAGALVTLGSDDPAMFGAWLGEELADLHAAGLDREGIVGLLEAGIDASFMPPEAKARRRAELRAAAGATGGGADGS